ncbi:hypothetical protein [Chenggangzhangella methanolivorans]|uniref:Uncharacterized protein n=1 Tax=Chenggangzhangella methanolivorans TaxID=1437009 RepID=A0A9E6UN97_9HYPH|nr:hypothetical protein [Chenggangzhangella methanolivorans]QZN98264.1 hypothetical protein K6K41_14000 [Chenggangzhangella methanolivorans]
MIDASEAVSNQIALIFRLKKSGLDIQSSESDLDRMCQELRQWQEYRTLLFIRKGMLDGPSDHRKTPPPAEGEFFGEIITQASFR